MFDVSVIYIQLSILYSSLFNLEFKITEFWCTRILNHDLEIQMLKIENILNLNLNFILFLVNLKWGFQSLCVPAQIKNYLKYRMVN